MELHHHRFPQVRVPGQADQIVCHPRCEPGLGQGLLKQAVEVGGEERPEQSLSGHHGQRPVRGSRLGALERVRGSVSRSPSGHRRMAK